MGLASLGLVVNFLLKLINEDKLCPERGNVEKDPL
jgi:hypothetical protein